MLQGFPESFGVGGSANPLRFYHMIGNAVCVPVVAAIAKCVVDTGVFEMTDDESFEMTR